MLPAMRLRGSATSQKLLAILLVLVASVSALHAVGMRRFWYWHYPWFDVVLHLLGGLAVGLGSLWLASVLGLLPMERWSSLAGLVTALVAAGVVGGAWEAYESWVGLVLVGQAGYVEDTVTDLGVDLVGAAAVPLAARLRSAAAGRRRR